MFRRSQLASVLMLACASSQAAPAWVQMAQAELEQRLRAAHPDVASWTLEPILSERQLSQGDVESEIAVDEVKLGKRSALQLSWRDGDERVRHTVWFSVAGERSGLVAATDIKRNEALLEETLRLDAHSAWDPECHVITSREAVQGMRTRKALRAGDAVCEQDVETKPLVARGERVTVRASAGLVSIELAGIAERDGNLGDRLPVRNPSSGESYMASVAGEGEVVVRE